MSSYSVSRRHEPMSRNVRRKCGIGSIRPMISTLCSFIVLPVRTRASRLQRALRSTESCSVCTMSCPRSFHETSNRLRTDVCSIANRARSATDGCVVPTAMSSTEWLLMIRSLMSIDAFSPNASFLDSVNLCNDLLFPSSSPSTMIFSVLSHRQQLSRYSSVSALFDCRTSVRLWMPSNLSYRWAMVSIACSAISWGNGIACVTSYREAVASCEACAVRCSAMELMSSSASRSSSSSSSGANTGAALSASAPSSSSDDSSSPGSATQSS
mmetsp:Transcript_38103/g.63313  ORF Transcript_38103/g.63313 Transcript_38103/m.63313 type:complete len:269 (-) Transcript_38103:1426-2232(-)